ILLLHQQPSRQPAQLLILASSLYRPHAPKVPVRRPSCPVPSVLLSSRRSLRTHCLLALIDGLRPFFFFRFRLLLCCCSAILIGILCSCPSELAW
ncbi:hypothetical protein P170DRAFT_394019, partial [Aspergillus steynii IBT 23096]